MYAFHRATPAGAERRVHVVALHASEAGRRIYERLGFRASNEMVWRAR